MTPLDAGKEKRFTYADYLAWPEDSRWELIGGVPQAMTPAPSTEHQRVLRRLGFQIEDFLLKSGKRCELFFAPFDVRLPGKSHDDDRITDVVQPDLLIVCDPAKIDARGCFGPPDCIIEITSSSTASRDFIVKRALYEKHGVPEYWIVHPLDKIVHVYLLAKGSYTVATHEAKGLLSMTAVPGLFVDFAAVFPSA